MCTYWREPPGPFCNEEAQDSEFVSIHSQQPFMIQVKCALMTQEISKTSGPKAANSIASFLMLSLTG